MGLGDASKDTDLLDSIVKKYGSSTAVLFDPTIISSNEALGKIIKLTFLVVSFFSLVPLGCYLVFKSQAVNSTGTSAVDTSYTGLFSKFSYSMFPFVPMAFIYTIMLPFNRVRWVLL